MFEWLAEKRQPVNQSWIVSWEILHQCNLHCEYCHYHTSDQPPDVEKSKNAVIRLNPGYLIISGGEPFLIPDLGSIVRDVYNRCNKPYTVINTNLTIRLEELYGLLDILDTIHISIDGLGDVNSIHRHINGDIVLNNLRKLYQEREERKSKTALLTLAVVTKENYTHIPDLAETLLSEFEDIYVSFGSVEPIGSKLSIVPYPEKLSWLADKIQPLLERYPGRLLPVGALAPSPSRQDTAAAQSDTRQKVRTWVKCKRQFFRAIVDSNGEIEQCKPGKFTDHYKSRVRDSLKRKEFRNAFTEFYKMIYTTIINPYDPGCPFPCKCEEMLDPILNGKEVPEIGIFEGHFSAEELHRASQFCKKHWDKPIPENIIEKLTEKQ